MKKKVFGRRFKKDINQRKALFRNLMRSLILNEEIKTTEAKAKAIKGQVEKLVTVAKRGEKAAYHLKKDIKDDAVAKLIKEIGPRFAKRPGGYTRIVKLGSRLKDNAEIVLLEFVEKGEKRIEKKVKKSEIKKTSKKNKAKVKKNIIKKISVKLKAVALKQTVTRQKKG